MAKLIDSAFTSLDGNVNDAGGNFEWALLEADVLAHINARERHVDTDLFSRRA